MSRHADGQASSRHRTSVSNLTGTRRRFVVTGAVAVLNAATGLPTWVPRVGVTSARAQAEPPVEDLPAGSNRYFPDTGHNLKDPFLARWTAVGGEAALGQPLSEERYEEGSGGVLQTFSGITLNYDPTQDTPWDIQGTHLSTSVREQVAPRSARAKVTGCSSRTNCRFFPETGHTISDALEDFWMGGGELVGLATFGYPISEPFKDSASGATVQVFEKVVLENRGGGDIRARAMGQKQAEEDGLLGTEAFLPAPPNGGETTLVNASDGLRLRSEPSVDAEMIALLPDKAEFIAVPGRRDTWVAGYVDGYAGWVSAEYLKAVPPLPKLAPADWNLSVWQGAALGETNVRSKPDTSAKIVDVLEYGNPLAVSAWVEGEAVFEGADLWAQTGPGRYVYARNVGRNAPVLPTPVPADAPTAGKWIDVSLVQQLMTAYNGRTPVRTVVTTTGMAGWETPPGYYQILSRVANETMTSGAIGAESFYKLEDVLFTQYFTDLGHALHFAWWRTPETIGRPGSHGCLNLLLDDARFFWDWATIGTPVYVHA
ncbi:MAG: L,D-transpeptidase family protein [Chloroflexota bacterium]|nr:L,D-transpeptidase family protein [Chloroflexota bacterium]